MRNDQVVTIRRVDYRPPAYLVDRVELEFDLDPDSTTVSSVLTVRRNPAGDGGPLVLDGEDLQLIGVEVDGRPSAYELADGKLTLAAPSERFTVRVRNTIAPRRNTELMGLYVSHGNFFTQCEAEGFRRITFFPDRPDVMATYTVTLRADRAAFPVLLSNGNLVGQGDVAVEGETQALRHWARWEDPFPKPSYLFALVAGRFVCNEEKLRTQSGREVLLQVWVEPNSLDKTAHAMASLKRAIRWDEERYGLELDLDRFMIVASHDFNMGAMENKGLNIFNAKYVLADAAIATDADYTNIESIVGHEYFHNWTGNRVTCRDWFQLSLKEGLTVFRDQEFSADMMLGDSAAHGDAGPWAKAVKRIEDVRALRAAQFPEDAGPMAHPVRPETYQEIGNFYTATVYEKGAEVVRMYQTLLGRDGFRRGMDLYFQRHDGQAVACDDFAAAMADANGRDLTQFARWYAQAGTPKVTVSARYDAAARVYELRMTQSCPPTPGQAEKAPFHIPFAVGLLANDGSELPLRLEGEPAASAGGAYPGSARTRVLELTETTQTFRFVDIKTAPVPSLARDFSAPVVVDYRYSDAELAFLAAFDSDGFNRWEAGQRLAVGRLLAATDAFEMQRVPQLDDTLLDVYRRLLADQTLAPAFKERALQLPAESFLAESRAIVDPEAIRSARLWIRREIGRRLAGPLRDIVLTYADAGAYSPDTVSAGRRGLRNLALGLLIDGGSADALDAAQQQLETATNMTDRHAALTAIVNSPAHFKVDALLRFARDWQHEPLVMNKWFNVQATAVAQPGEPAVLTRVKALLKHAAFSLSNPNNVYALVLGFTNNNPAEFHRADGSGYAFWLDIVLQLDQLNPTVAARTARALDRWRKFTPDRARQMRDVLIEVARAPELSRDVREIVTKALEN
jgi:aminopeptidase N